jgi:ATP-dependent exoDNAse (exonuclease V) beta subunit
MTTLTTPSYLSTLNAHPRDEFISFEEGPHIYTVNGERGTYKSVTTWNHSHFPHFNTDKILDSIMKGKNINNPTYKYYGMSREQIKALWDENRDKAASAGTKMHYDIECFYNQMEVNNDSVEFAYFSKFVADFPELKPYRTEWMVYHEDIKISGSIDMIYENPDGTLQIYDWKRCQEISYENMTGESALTPCIKHLPNTNFWHYSLQLNVYKRILEEKYDKKITNLCLVCLHPNNRTYDIIDVPILDKEMDDLFALRKMQIESSLRKPHP